MTVTREFEMDEARCLADPGFAPPAESASAAEKQVWLEETFYELCGFERDEDHIDGSYVQRKVGIGWGYIETEFEWPEGLR
jgi:hypothetical protein